MNLAGWKTLSKLRRAPLQTVSEMARESSDLVPLRIAGYNIFLINDPQYAFRILSQNVNNYDKNTPLYKVLRQFFNEGLLTSDGDEWTRHRRMIQPAFHKARLRTFANAMTLEASAMVERWHQRPNPDAILDMYKEMADLTLRIVAKTLFSLDVGDASAFAEAVDYLNKDGARRFTSSLPLGPILPFGRDRKFRQARALVYEFVNGVLEERYGVAEQPDDVLAMMMAARDESGTALTIEELRDEILILLLAGHETTANALTWTWYLLSIHADVRRRLEAEIESVVGDRLPTVEDLPSLTYTRQVIDESLRLYPPGWRFTRRAVAEDRLGEHVVPANSIVVILPYNIHRNPAVWPNPEAFDPDRFTPEETARRHPFAFIPFGGGRRTCIGSQYAMMEMQLILATVARHYRPDLAPGHHVVPQGDTTLHSGTGMPMRLSRRPVSAGGNLHVGAH